MTGGHVAGIRSSIDHRASLAGITAECNNVGAVKASASPCREQNRLATGQRFGPQIRALVLAGLGRDHEFLLGASARRNAPDALRPERREVDHVVGSPACPNAIPGGADILRDASGDGSLF